MTPRHRAFSTAGLIAVIAALTWGRWGASSGLVMPGDDPASIIEFSSVEMPACESNMRCWEARFAGPSGTAHFDVLMEVREPRGDEEFAFTRGLLRSREDSRAGDLLTALARAHKGFRRLGAVARVATVPFDTAILGLTLSRGNGTDVLAGEFTSNPVGPWIVAKVFLPAEGAELFIAINPSGSVGLFLSKDPEYWIDLEPVLASVL